MVSRGSVNELDHPTIKMLALSFLILIGVALVGEGFEMHIPKHKPASNSIPKRDDNPNSQ